MRSMIRTILISVFAILTFSGFSQNQKVWNLPNFDRKWVHFGFTLGINTMDYRLNTDLTQVDSLISLETNSQPGFNIGIVSELHLSNYFGLRFLPALSFGQRNLEYVFRGREQNIMVTKAVESTYLEFPLLLKYRSKRLNNFAAYFVGGAKYAADLSSQAEINNRVPPPQQVVRLGRHNFMYEIGFGFDFFLEYFKFSPEIKVSTGVRNMLIDEGSIWELPIDHLQPRVISISLHFEG